MPSQLVVTNNKNSGLGSLREAIALAQSGDTIKFDSSLAGKTITLTTGQLEIRPGKNLIIDGANAPGLTLSGNKASRIFFVNSNQDFPASLTLKNLTLTKGYTDERGGAINVTHKGALTVENVEFKNNVADKGGGAIYSAWETELTVTGSKFNGNKAIAGNDERGAGAIAFVSPGKFTVKDSEFTNNQGINGGAINSLQGKLTIENSKFINNNTTAAFYDTGKSKPDLRGYGGAVYTDRASSPSEDTSGTIRISNSVFEGNKGRAEGGAAYLYTSPQDKVIIEDSLFQNNEILPLPNGNKGNGGAVVQLSNGLNQGLTIRNTTFANNTAAHQGGGLWTYDAPTKIINSTFSGNKTTGDTAGSFGGGMALYSPTTIERSTIAYNHASWVGGGVRAKVGIDVTVKNTIFYKNTADNGSNNWGVQQHTDRELIDKGGNVQYPPKATNNSNDYNATATIKIIDPQLGPLQDNGGPVPTHAVGNPDVKNAGAFFSTSNGIANSDANTTVKDASLLVTTISDQEAKVDQPLSIDSRANDNNDGVISDVFDVTVNPSTNEPNQRDDSDNQTLALNIQNNLLGIEGNPQQAKLQFTLTGGESRFVNEIGIFAIDDAQGSINGIVPGEAGYLQAALGRGKVVFSVLPDRLGGSDLTRLLKGFSGNNLGLYLVQNSTTDNVLADLDAGRTPTNVFFALTSANTNGTDYLQVSDLGNGTFGLNWRDQSRRGQADFNNLAMTVQLTDDSPVLGTRLQTQRELIDLRDQVGLVQANFNRIESEARFNNSVGLYVVENEQGAVKDPLTGVLINPGEVGYAQVALAQRVVTDINRNTGTLLTELEGGTILAPYIIANGTTEGFLTQNPNNQRLGSGDPIAYFAYLGANPDRVDHIRLLGNNTFGFEDLYGGGDQDFNDMVFRVELTVA